MAEYEAPTGYYGREVLLTDEPYIDASNLIDVLRDIKLSHDANSQRIDYLWKYYKGKTPILDKTKVSRPEINNKVNENMASQIVNFWTGYLCGEPVQYVSRNQEHATSDAIGLLNDFMYGVNKHTHDRDLIEWQMICGTSYRMVLPVQTQNEKETPFKMYTLDPRYTFVVYSSDIDHTPLMGGTYYTKKDNSRVYSIYTPSTFFKVEADKIVEETPHSMGAVPIFEYAGNNARLGAFEIVLPLLDALNTLESNRIDSVEGIAQALLKIIGADMDEEAITKFSELGAIQVPEGCDVQFISSEIKQGETQTLVDYINQKILTICGIPTRGDSGSGGDNGVAIIYRNGWSDAESRAKAIESTFKKNEQDMLRLVLKMCSTFNVLDLSISDIDIKFTRRNYENIATKSQVLIAMLQQPKIDPLLAFTHCGMFSDPESAYAMSKAYYEETLKAYEPVIEDEGNDDGNTEDI